MPSLNVFLIKYIWMWFPVLMDREKPGGTETANTGHEGRFWLVRPEGRKLKGFPEVSVLSSSSAEWCRGAERDWGQKPCLEIEQSWLCLLICWRPEHRQVN